MRRPIFLEALFETFDFGVIYVCLEKGDDSFKRPNFNTFELDAEFVSEHSDCLASLVFNLCNLERILLNLIVE